MPSTSSTEPAHDGTPLLVRSWPPSGPAWLHVLIVHGLEDHSGRYERVGEQFAANGIAGHAYDQRWSGESGGRRGDAESWGLLLDDLAGRLDATREAAAGLPVAIHAHSWGGLLAADYLLTDRPKPNAAVLTAPALGDNLPGWKHAVAKLGARLLPAVRLPNGIEPETLARDRSDGRLYGDDPLRIGTTSLRLGGLSVAAQARVTSALRGASVMPVPTLVLHGADDVLVPPRASEPFDGLTGAKRVVYPGLRHELHNEPEGAAVIADVVAWLRQQVEGAANASV